jgi:hypothetical protein
MIDLNRLMSNLDFLFRVALNKNIKNEINKYEFSFFQLPSFTFSCDSKCTHKNSHNTQKEEKIFNHFVNHDQLGTERFEEREYMKQTHVPNA